MKERPILFSAPMVRAILDGRKTVTRRTNGLDVLNLNMPDIYQLLGTGDLMISRDNGDYCAMFEHGEDNEFSMFIKSPYGRTGDRLWVREAWATHACFDAIAPRDLTTRSIAYSADGKINTGKGRPSIHMPRWASRILLEITAVRVERLQDITWDQAIAEGISIDSEGLFHVEDSRHLAADPRDSFQGLWESINGDDSWAANPWCWAISFKRVEVPNADQ